MSDNHIKVLLHFKFLTATFVKGFKFNIDPEFLNAQSNMHSCAFPGLTHLIQH